MITCMLHSPESDWKSEIDHDRVGEVSLEAIRRADGILMKMRELQTYVPSDQAQNLGEWNCTRVARVFPEECASVHGDVRHIAPPPFYILSVAHHLLPASWRSMYNNRPAIP